MFIILENSFEPMKKAIAFITGLIIKLENFLKMYWKRIFGAGIYHILSWIFDNPIWVSVELIWGVNGVIAMVAAAVVINFCLLIYYRNKKAKFVLWDALDAYKEKEVAYRDSFNLWKKRKTSWNMFLVAVAYIPAHTYFLFLRILKVRFLGDIAALLLLSIFEDPFVATTYLRHGNSNGLKAKELGIFFSSVVVSIGYWAIRNGIITEVLFRPILRF